MSHQSSDKQGFLKIFNGSWTVEPIAVEGKPTVSKLTVQQEVLPSFMPPGPLGKVPVVKIKLSILA